MTNDSLGVIGTSQKTDERRVPFHPGHLSCLNKSARDHFISEEDGAGADANSGELDSTRIVRQGKKCGLHQNRARQKNVERGPYRAYGAGVRGGRRVVFARV
jgi:hypothetical protein